MRWRAAGLALLLAGCSAPPAPAPAPAPATPQQPAAAAAVVLDPARGGRRSGEWARAESERDELPLVWEYRENYAPAPPQLLPQLVVVSLAREIPYLGQHDAAEQAGFDRIEQRLVSGLQGRAELVAVLEWNRQHDWFLYAEGGVDRATLAALFSDQPGLDIQVTLEDDAGAQFYRTLRERVGATP